MIKLLQQFVRKYMKKHLVPTQGNIVYSTTITAKMVYINPCR